LDVLPLEEAVALLENRTGRRDTAEAKMLAEALDRLPLALDHAAAYCKRTQTRFADYAEKASSLISTAPRGVGYPRSVAATFDLASAEAVAQCPEAEPLNPRRPCSSAALYERALAICEKVLGPEHPNTASSLGNFASLLMAQGDLAGARPLYERALAIREKV